MSRLDALTIDDIYEEFEHLADWEEQCDFLIDLGLDLPPFPEEARDEAHRVHGCQSMVWLVTDLKPGPPDVIDIRADSDSMIVKGLIAVLLTVYSGRTPQEILATDIRGVFTRLGLDRHLSSARKNGLHGMVQRIRSLAEQAA